MKTISIDEFKKLVSRKDWNRKQNHEIIDSIDRQVEEYNEEREIIDLISIPHVWGFASKTSKIDDIEITYTEGFNCDEFDTKTLCVGTEGQEEIWSVSGVVVLDENCEEIDANELSEYLSLEFSNIDYGFLEVEENEIECDSSEFEKINLNIDNEPNIKFFGKKIGSASSYKNNSTRWTNMVLYKTNAGKFVCHRVGRTIIYGESDRYSGKVCKTIECVKEFFGYRWLAKELYDSAGIDYSVEVE